ncbi:MAG TPA: head-tail connector protein [Mycobacterium sp.]|nr:head-tail connector protein [Mycobacterium sp.]
MEDVSPLVSIEDAKRHLRETANVTAQTDADIQAKLDQATAFVWRTCGSLADEDWDETTVPAPVYTAVLLHLSELYADRGDVERGKPFGEDTVRYLMAAGYRDPVVA